MGSDALSWPEIAGIIALATFGMTFVGVAWKLHDRIAKGDDSIRRDVEVVRSDLASFREQVAREYVSREHLRELEDRLVSAIERLGDRLDRLFEKDRAR